MALGELSNVRLTEEQEKKLLIRSKRKCECQGNHSIHCDPCDARSELIDAHSRFLMKLCREHCKAWHLKDIKPEELMADAIDGLCKAINSIRILKHKKLINYSRKFVIGSLADSDLTNGIIQKPVWVRELRRRITRIKKEANAYGHDITLEEIADKTGNTVKTIKTALGTTTCELGLYTPSPEDSSDPEILSKLGVEDSHDWIEEDYVENLMSVLSEDEKNIICAKFGIGQEKLSGKEMTEEFGRSQLTLLKICNKALDKMKSKAISE